MRVVRVIAGAWAVSILAGCGHDLGPGAPHERSGVVGTVRLGPQCPVERADDPCPDSSPAGVLISVARPLAGDPSAAGEVVAHGTTDIDGTFRVDVAPGHYLLTADAGMSCELVDARVTSGAYSEVDVRCDTGIR